MVIEGGREGKRDLREWFVKSFFFQVVHRKEIISVHSRQCVGIPLKL